ncbi:MAG: nucleotidyltransferase family protein [Ignavibacteriaceae bacterium]
MQAMILAAGLGTRLRPLTDSTPKALIKIKEFTLLELQIRKLESEGFNEIIINIHHFAEQIKEYLKQKNFPGCSITISDESKKLLDTGGGLKKAAYFFSAAKPILVYNVDILSDINLKKLLDYHMSSGTLATLAVRERKSSRKFLFDKENILLGWKNENANEQIIVRDPISELVPLAFSGVQIIDPAIFKYFSDEDVFSIVDLYLSAAKKEKINGYIHNKDNWLDLGKTESLNEAERVFEKIRNTYRV